LKSLSREF